MGVLKSFDCSVVDRAQAMTGTDSYNVIKPGMSYGAFCKSAGCRAQNHLVVVNRGPGSHLINDDIMSGALKCPVCSKEVELAHVMLYQCTATVTVHKQQEERSTFTAKNSEIVKVGVRNDQLSQQGGYLMECECRVDSRSPDCIVS